MNKLEAKDNILEKTVKAMAVKIEVLEDKLHNQNEESNSSSKIESEQCTYQANSTTVLKLHITTKHTNLHKQELIRELDPHKPLHLNQPTEERAEISNTLKEVEEAELKCNFLILVSFAAN